MNNSTICGELWTFHLNRDWVREFAMRWRNTRRSSGETRFSHRLTIEALGRGFNGGGHISSRTKQRILHDFSRLAEPKQFN